MDIMWLRPETEADITRVFDAFRSGRMDAIAPAPQQVSDIVEAPKPQNVQVSVPANARVHTATSWAALKRPKAWQKAGIDAGIPPLVGETHKAYNERVGKVSEAPKEQVKDTKLVKVDFTYRRKHYVAEAKTVWAALVKCFGGAANVPASVKKAHGIAA